MVPVSQKHMEYARKVEDALRQDLVRVEVDASDATMGKKIRTGATRKIPILLIVGDREQEAGRVTVRRYKIKQQESKSFEDFLAELQTEIAERKHVRPN